MLRDYLTQQDRLSLLIYAGVKEFNPEKNTGFCTCCGTSRLVPTTAQPYSIYYGMFKPDEDIRIPVCSESLLIPDATGNLLIQWEDK